MHQAMQPLVRRPYRRILIPIFVTRFFPEFVSGGDSVLIVRGGEHNEM